MRQILHASLFVALLGVAPALYSATPAELLQRLDNYPHAQRINHSITEVVDYEIGLGAIKKVRGVWQLDESERLSGELHRYTWQITDGFTSGEVLDEAVAALSAGDPLFSCDGRACGRGVQWANRIFNERLLYGRDDLQRYRVFGGGDWRVLMFSAARTADRQYLHVEWLDIRP